VPQNDANFGIGALVGNAKGGLIPD
jgi:hypothetical protein